MKVLNKKTILIVLIIILCLAGGVVGYFYLSQKPQSQGKVIDFIWDKEGEKIYYLTLTEDQYQFRSFNPQAQTILGAYDQEIKTRTNSPNRAYWSSENKALFLDTASSNNFWLNLFDFETQKLTPVLLEQPGQIYAWSVDGSHIAYTTRPDQNLLSNINVFSTNTLKTSHRNLLGNSPKIILQIWWALRGQKLLIQALPNADSIGSKLYILDLESKEVSPVFAENESYTNFTPLNEKLLFLSSEGIVSLNLKNQNRQILFDFKGTYEDINCVWLDENQIICQMFKDSYAKRSFIKIDINSSKQDLLFEIPIKNLEDVNLYFACSPKKDKLAYLSEAGIIEIITL